MRIHIFGDSHVNALRQGAMLLSERSPGAPQFETTFNGRTCANWIDFEWAEADGRFHAFGASVPNTQPVDYRIEERSDVYVFSSPLFSGLTYVQGTWRHCCPWSCIDANPDMYAISTAVIETYVENQLRCRLDFIVRLQACGYRIAVVEPPKPLRRTPVLFDVRGDVLRAVDDLHRRYAVRRLEEHGITVLSAPDETHKDGFTIDAYAIDEPTDTHHGNPTFGALMILQIICFAQDDPRRDGAASPMLAAGPPGIRSADEKPSAEAPPRLVSPSSKVSKP